MTASDLKQIHDSPKIYSWIPRMGIRDGFPPARNYQLKRFSILIRSLLLYYRAKVSLRIKKGVSHLRYWLR